MLMIFTFFEARSVATSVPVTFAVPKAPPEGTSAIIDYGLPERAYGLLWLEIPLLIAVTAGILWLALARRQLLAARLAVIGVFFAELLFFFAFMQPELVDIELPRTVRIEQPETVPVPESGPAGRGARAAPFGSRSESRGPRAQPIEPTRPEGEFIVRPLEQPRPEPEVTEESLPESARRTGPGAPPALVPAPAPTPPAPPVRPGAAPPPTRPQQ
jgi:hypothetical protein